MNSLLSSIIWCVFISLMSNSLIVQANSCGNYNPTSHVCCEGNLIASAGISPSCCGTKMHDSAFRLLINIFLVSNEISECYFL